MKNFKSILGLIIAFVIIASCKKEEIPTPSEEVPVFTFSGEIDGIQKDLKAGQNNYYLYSSVTQDANGLKTYSANLTLANCIDVCENSLKISFIDYASSLPNPTDLDSTFYIGNYNFATNSGLASRYSVSFTKNTAGANLSGIDWTFGDGKTESALNPVHTYSRPGKYEYCMDADFSGACSSNLCNSISLGNMGDFIEVNLIAGNPVGTSVNFSGSAAFGQLPYQYFWDFGDGNTSTNEIINHSYVNEGVYTVTLTAIDANGISKIQRQNIRTQNSNSCVARNTYVVSPISNPNNYGNVVVEWVDSNGNVYTSKNDGQNLRSFFKVNSIEEYNLNENGQKTKKLNITFSCTLFNGTNQIELKNATAVIAVAY